MLGKLDLSSAGFFGTCITINFTKLHWFWRNLCERQLPFLQCFMCAFFDTQTRTILTLHIQFGGFFTQTQKYLIERKFVVKYRIVKVDTNVIVRRRISHKQLKANTDSSLHHDLCINNAKVDSIYITFRDRTSRWKLVRCVALSLRNISWCERNVVSLFLFIRRE